MTCMLCEQKLVVEHIYSIGKQSCNCKFCNTSLQLNPSQYRYKGIIKGLHSFLLLSKVNCLNCNRKLDLLYFPCEDNNDPNAQTSQSISDEELEKLFKVPIRETVSR